MLGRLGAVPETPELRDDVCLLEGTLPAANVYALQQQLPGLTRGEGVMESGVRALRGHGEVVDRVNVSVFE